MPAGAGPVRLLSTRRPRRRHSGAFSLDAVQPGNRISKQGDAGRGIGAVDHQESNGPQRQQADNLQRTAPQAALFQQPVPQKLYQGHGNVEDSDVSHCVSLPHDAGVGVEQGGDGCETGQSDRQLDR